MGDGSLVEFASVVDAVNCGIEVQSALAKGTPTLADGSRLQLRIGINLGDIMIADGDLYGDRVNIASRIESLADPGGVAVSESVACQAIGKVDTEIEDLGLHSLKNIAEPVRVFRVLPEGASAPGQRSNRCPLLASALVLVGLCARAY